MSDIEDALETQRYSAASLVEECIKEIFHSIEKPRTLKLANGVEGELVTFYEPKFNEDRGCWTFGLDVQFKGLPIDHLEFCMDHTGQGGTVIPD